MADNDSPIPPHVCLVEFLDGLPATIRGNVLFICSFGLEVGSFVDLGTIDNLKLMKDFLDEAPGSLKGYRCAQMVGVVETALVHRKGIEDDNQALYEETGHTVFRDIAARAPLNEKHFERARAQFAELRQSVLSPGALSLWIDLYRD